MWRKKLNLPGFGEQAVARKDGSKAPLKRFDDWYAYYLSNVATQCEHLPEVTDSDRELAALPRAMKPLEPVLTAEQCAQVEALLSRGGYYEKSDKYNGDILSQRRRKNSFRSLILLSQLRSIASAGKPIPVFRSMRSRSSSTAISGKSIGTKINIRWSYLLINRSSDLIIPGSLTTAIKSLRRTSFT